MIVQTYLKENLKGMKLEIKSVRNRDGYMSIGRDPETGVMYLLKMEVKPERND